MIATTYTFALGDLRIDGSVELTPAGFDIVRAIIMRGITTAKKGEDKAREMLKVEGGDMFRRSLNYYRNAGAFLRHMLATTRGMKHNVRDELHALRSVPADAPYPPEWKEYLDLAADLEQPDEPGKPTRKGRGTGNLGESGAATPKGTRRRNNRKGTTDGGRVSDGS